MRKSGIDRRDRLWSEVLSDCGFEALGRKPVGLNAARFIVHKRIRSYRDSSTDAQFHFLVVNNIPDPETLYLRKERLMSVFAEFPLQYHDYINGYLTGKNVTFGPLNTHIREMRRRGERFLQTTVFSREKTEKMMREIRMFRASNTDASWRATWLAVKNNYASHENLANSYRRWLGQFK